MKVASVRRAGGAAALNVIMENWRRYHEGITHGVLGNRGSGKSTNLRHVVDALASEGATDIGLIIDDKNSRERLDWGAGRYIVGPDELLDSDTRVVIKGDRWRGIYPDVERIAADALMLARAPQADGKNLKLTVVLDEAKRALTDSGKEWTSPSMREIATEGRNLGISLPWTTQSPQELPRALVNNSTTIAFHTMGPNSARYLGDAWMLDPHMVDVMRSLGRGEFVLKVDGVDTWDRTIYMF